MSATIGILEEDAKAARKLSFKVSYFLQSIIRRWEFPLFNIAFSLWFWYHFHLFGDPAIMWNQVYSLMAIVVESIVGIGMWGQANRDAKILRYVAHMFKLLEDLEETNCTQLKHLETLLEFHEPAK